LRSFRVQKTLNPDIYLPMHPESYFAGKANGSKQAKLRILCWIPAPRQVDRRNSNEFSEEDQEERSR